MWGREMRAGLVFVLVSLAVGTAVRGYRRAHETRFQDLVDRLEEGELSRLEREGRERRSESPDSAAAAGAGAGPAGPGAPEAGGHRAAAPGGAAPALRPASIDLNRADRATLIRLPGIGPALAGRIVADRDARGPFTSPEMLLRVPGVGPKILARVRGYLAPAALPAAAAAADTARASPLRQSP